MQPDPTKFSFAGILQKAPPAADDKKRAGSEELVQDMEKMDVDSESKVKKDEDKDTIPKVKADDEESENVKQKHLDVIKRLQKLVQELLLADDKKEESKEKVDDVMEMDRGEATVIAAH
jgi:hypothetical protein